MTPLDSLAGRIVESIEPALQSLRPISATYRLQFRSGQFGFSDAREIVGYVGDLGISHVYSSPLLRSRAGSSHGYDVADPTRLNEDLGTEEEFQAFVAELHRCGLGQVLDIVPNHMTVATDENVWWMDVLRSGPASPYAGYFDVDWHPVKRELDEKVLIPFLGDLYGRVLERGELPVLLQDGAFFVSCAGMKIPLDPQTWSRVLAPGVEELAAGTSTPSPDVLELQSILTALQYLPPRSDSSPEKTIERSRERVVIQNRLKRLLADSPAIATHVEQNLSRLNGTPGEPRSFDELDQLLELQAFRLVHWRASSDEINYRRFFDVTELAAVCTEFPEVFEAIHRKVLDLLAAGDVDAFRVDHVDGLFDPPQYLWRLQWALLRVIARNAFGRLMEGVADAPAWEVVEPVVFERLHERIGGPDPRSLFVSAQDASHVESQVVDSRPLRALPAFVLVEKILGVDEPLPGEWPVEGTTGYDFLNLVNGLFVQPQGLAQLTRHYARFTDVREDLREIVYECKWLVLSGAMQSDVQLLANRLDRLSNRNRHSRDYTLQALRTAIREIIACFPVYRTYIHGDVISDRDRRIVQLAVATARRQNPALETSVFDFVRDVLLLTQPPDLDEEGRAEREFFVGRFQQVTSPVMAKGVEDTAFYRYLPLVSLDEVGGEPTHAVTEPKDFHEENLRRASRWPRAMLATTTHDTKRTEDVRARIHVLSEVPGPWRSALQRWTRWNRKYRREVDGRPAPSRNDEWLFYQTLVGVWPLQPPSDAETAALVERLQAYMLKATREAKLRTSWVTPNSAYDEAVRNFTAEILTESSGRFVADLQAFVDSIVDSGLYSSLSQVVLKVLAPGFPDIYQGQEIWDFSLVDPDNRRPVDYSRRRELLADLKARTSSDSDRLALARELSRSPRDDRTKLFVTWTALQVRRTFAASFAEAAYTPLVVTGARADHVCAFARRSPSGEAVVVVVPRLLQRLQAESGRPAPCGDVWLDTAVTASDSGGVRFRDAFTHQSIAVSDGALRLAEILEPFPVAILTTEPPSR